MSVSELSPSTQNYLKVIQNASEWSNDPITTTELASRLGLKTSTVSDGLRKLAAQNLVAHAPYGTIELTDKGRNYALGMIRRHRLLESFLVSVLGYGWEEVHDEADNLEHAVSDFMVDRIDALLEHPTRDPHGDPIPDAKGKVAPCEMRLLEAATPDSRVRVERVNDADPQLLTYLATAGITVGSEINVSGRDHFAETLEITSPTGKAINLGPRAVSAIRVSAPL